MFIEEPAPALQALPAQVAWTQPDLAGLRRDGQTRLWWDRTPVDIFLNTTAFHRAATGRVQWHAFGASELPFLACDDLAVCKAFFARTQDWADLEAMAQVGTLDFERVAGVLAVHLGAGDARLARLLALPR